MGKAEQSISTMTDRELLEEIAQSQRETEELVKSFIEAMSKNPILKTMAGRFM